MAQQYLPRAATTPRYASQALGVPYVSAYDPSVADRYAGLMQQEYGKAMMANQAMAQREGEIADVFSEDLEGKEQVLGQYKERVNKIREVHNQDLALAAPELARAIMDERSNPWYAKNVQYNKESERRQKLLDQFGPNIRFFRDLPKGNLNDIGMEDIGFDYYNRAHFQDAFQDMWGDLAKKTTDLGLENIPGYPAFVKQRTLKGATAGEIEDLVSGEGKTFIVNSLEQMGLEPTEQNVTMLTDELNNWTNSSLIGGETTRIMQNPAYDTSGGTGGIPPNLFNESNLVKVEEQTPEAPTRREASKSGRDIMSRLDTGKLTFEEQDALEGDPELISMIKESPHFTAFNETVPSLFGEIPSDQQQEIIKDLRESSKGIKDANDAVEDVLEKYGIVEVTTMTTPQGITGTRKWKGENISERQMKKKIKSIVEEFKTLRGYNNSAEGKKLAKAVNAQVNPIVETGVYAFKGESQSSMQNYVNDVVLSTSADNLAISGSYIEKRSGEDANIKKTSKKIEDLKAINKNTKIGRITYKESGPKGKAPELIVDTSEGKLHIPLKGEQGEIHGMEVSLNSLDPKVINDVFRSYYDKELSKAGGSISIGEAFGDKTLEIPGMSEIYRTTQNGHQLYVAPVGDQQLVGATPTELYQKIALYINKVLPDQYRANIQNPTLGFLIRRYSDLLTPTKKAQAVAGQISSIIQ